MTRAKPIPERVTRHVPFYSSGLPPVPPVPAPAITADADVVALTITTHIAGRIAEHRSANLRYRFA